jgi:hypothetical protein
MTLMQRFRVIPTLAALAALTLLMGSRSCLASQVLFTTPTGQTTSGGPVNATALFTTSTGSLTITLTNLQANPTDVAQTISDIRFTLSGGNLTLATSNSLIVPVPLVLVAANGTFTSSTGPAGWVFSTPNSTTGLLDVLNGTGHAGPANEIIGPPNGSGVYSNANGSIAANGPHNPFINQMATFTILGAGITSSTIVDSATFSFGTQPEFVNGVPRPVPEPSTLVMAASAVMALGFLDLRRRRRRSSAATA